MAGVRGGDVGWGLGAGRGGERNLEEIADPGIDRHVVCCRRFLN